MNPSSTHFILGYHGCDQRLAEEIFRGTSSLAKSTNSYDWLGTGIYFWEYNVDRAFHFATEVKGRGKLRKPTVVGAIIDLGFCLNLLDTRAIQTVQHAFRDFQAITSSAQAELPQNSGGRDYPLRHLDCAVLNHLHKSRHHEGLPAFDTVRAAFVEGEPLYKGAGFATKTHIQICVTNPKCIKGYFRPLDDDGHPIIFT